MPKLRVNYKKQQNKEHNKNDTIVMIEKNYRDQDKVQITTDNQMRTNWKWKQIIVSYEIIRLTKQNHNDKKHKKQAGCQDFRGPL